MNAPDAISNRSAAICLRMSPTLKSRGSGSLWSKIWDEARRGRIR